MTQTMLNIRVTEGMKATIENIVDDIGLWDSRSDFVREAIRVHINKHIGDKPKFYK